MENNTTRTRRRNSPDIGISKLQNDSVHEGDAIRDGLNLIQGSNLINSNDVVVITPNWVNNRPPESGTVVGVQSLQEIIRFVKESNPKRIVVAAGSGGKSTTEIMTAAGFDKIVKDEGVEFIDLNSGPFTRISLNHPYPSATNLNRLFDEMTFLISFTQLKYHEEATISACIKNIALGWPPAEEHGHPKKNLGIHEDLHGFIRAMAQAIPIDLSILSANPAMIGTGPSKGIPKHTGIVLCGTDPVAADTAGARLLGFKPQGVRYLYECMKANLGVTDTNSMNIKGLQLQEAENAFSIAAYGQKVAVD